MDKGTLYIVSTPIGNLGDMTRRGAEILSGVDAIAAEDTRHTLGLLNSLNIKNRLISFHEHSDAKKAQAIIDMLLEGQSIALVTDAGTPLISDPGAPLVELAYENGIPVSVVPGACAAIAALTLSALPLGRFVFEGFLPKGEGRREAMERLCEHDCTFVVYESPHQLARTLKELFAALGDRRITITKELTKIYESAERTTLARAADEYAAREIRGEYVLVIEGAERIKKVTTDEDIKALLSRLISEGESAKNAVKAVSEELNVPKNRVYTIMKEEML